MRNARLKAKIPRLTVTGLVILFYTVLLNTISIKSVFAQAKQNGLIEGRVLNADHQPEENVIVVLLPANKLAGSDDNGHFEFRNIPYGQYTISVKSLGVTAAPVSVDLKATKVTTADVLLKEQAKELEKVIVSSSYRHVDKNSSQVARMPLSYIENPQNYAVVPKELLQTQLATTTEQALLNIPGVSNMAIVGGSGGSTLTFKSRGVLQWISNFA